jgi:hypothetical protein
MVDPRAHFDVVSARGELHSRCGGRFAFTFEHGRFKSTLVLRDVPRLRATFRVHKPYVNLEFGLYTTRVRTSSYGVMAFASTERVGLYWTDPDGPE